MTELEQHLLDTVERMGREQRQREIALRQSMRNLTGQLDGLSRQVNALADQVESLQLQLRRLTAG
jgi:hypothetical protein